MDRLLIDKERYMMQAALISLWFNIVLFTFKLVSLVIVRSLAIATDFAITVVGLTVSIILYNSLKLSLKPADLAHNYGYGKVEHVCEAMEGVVLLGIGMVMSFQAFAALFHPSHGAFPWVGLASSVLSFTLNFIGAFLIFRLAHKSASPAVKAEGIHYALEGFISLAIACAFFAVILLKNTPYAWMEPYLDPAVTIFVSILIAIPSIKLTQQAFVNLLDISIEEPRKLEVVTQLARYTDYFCNFQDLKTRSAGHKKFVELKIILNSDMPLARAHETVSGLERDIAAAVPDSEVTVGMIPCLKDCSFLKNNQPCPYLDPKPGKVGNLGART